MRFATRDRAKNHLKCAEFIRHNNDLLISTLPCLTEAMYFLGKLAGWQGQAALWLLIENAPLTIHHPNAEEMARMQFLMEKYQDTPMDFADASQVVAAESLGIKRIFTLDGDFYVYRINDTESFEVIP